MVGGNNSFAKTICSICYEDLKPIVEDLQSISICGHVFHELCIQQWFEYCSNGKKKSCPVCKQTCSEVNVGRLYFQSIGNANDPISTQKPLDCGENPEELRREVKKLEATVKGLSSGLESQLKDIKELNEELYFCKEQAIKEAASKNEALKQKTNFQRLFLLKSEELDRSTSECTRLQERNMALAKELAALKLVSDLNLEEEEILKLASLGNEANSKETVDILKRSLVIRNKSYKELMAKCNILGRGEARSLNKLDKAKEKIKKLKTRVQELETAFELKDNEVLRALKASKKSTCKEDVADGVNLNSKSSSINKSSSKCQMEESIVQKINLEQTGSVTNDLFGSREKENMKPKDMRKNNAKDDSKIDTSSFVLIDEDASEISTSMHEVMHPDSKPQVSADIAIKGYCMSRSEADSNKKEETLQHGPSSKVAVSCSKNGSDVNTPSAAMDKDLVLLLDDNAEVQPMLCIKKGTPGVPIARPGDRCFAGGLLGPDGTKRHLGKWCKRVQDKGSTEPFTATQQASTNTSDLIAVGADGRGGKIKVLRSIDQSSLDNKESSPWAKKCKYGSKTSSLQSQGHLQIEHFFRKSGQ
ncbi:uncharacterized protein LOC132276712 [Cornus florida]|uniref:uncharacterized protein LOC132276712 n=1 Tax=Cornus florida TaxID=4283 RepID=UPI002897E466|nr:uncharacterized protein LOC132276712 [Cornus florida]